MASTKVKSHENEIRTKKKIIEFLTVIFDLQIKQTNETQDNWFYYKWPGWRERE